MTTTTTQTIFRDLRYILATIYDNEISARRVAQDATLDIVNIGFSQTPINNWHAILTEAIKADKVATLLEIARNEYPTNQYLQHSRDQYQRLLVQEEGFAGMTWPSTEGDAPGVGVSPYKGLPFFDVQDATIFFGREQLTAQLVAHLRQHRFLAVVGASGSGKSSVVRAGLVASLGRADLLADGSLPPAGAVDWPVYTLTPSAEPLEALADKLTRDHPSVTAMDQLIADMRNNPRSLHRYVTRRLADRAPSAEHLLLVVDQFEELFMLCDDVAKRKSFVDNLLSAVTTAGPTMLVITLRADFYARCAEFDDLRQALATNQIYIGAMNEQELRAAVVKPASAQGWEFEVGLADLLLQDVTAEPGALPLLSHALHETWRRRRGRTLTFAGYVAAGRVQGAIAQTAEQLFRHQLTTQQQGIARNIFLRLTTLGDETLDTRRRVTLDELFTPGNEPQLIREAIQTLADARLITTSGTIDTGDAVIEAESADNKIYIDVAHEALIREWRRLRNWLDENREALLFQQRLDGEVAQWRDAGRDPNALLRGRFLDAALEWCDNHPTLVVKLEREFIEQSLAVHQKEEHSRQRRARFRVVTMTAITLLLFPALFLGANIWMFYRRQASDWQSTNFPSAAVLSIAVAPTSLAQSAPAICVGTADLGVGCSRTAASWNILQSGLPTGAPAAFNTSARWWGAVSGSQWPATVKGIRLIAFDRANTERIFAFVNGYGLYVSANGGSTWAPFANDPPTNHLPTYDADKLLVNDNQLLVGFHFNASSQLAKEQHGSLWYSNNDGGAWQQIAGKAMPSGVVYDFYTQWSNSEQVGRLYVVAEKGVFSALLDGEWGWQKHDSPDDGSNFRLIVANNNPETLYLAAYDPEQTTGALYRWHPQEESPPEPWSQPYGQEPRVLAIDPRPGAPVPVWILFISGDIVSVSADGVLTEQRGHPGWPWSFKNDLQFFTDEVGRTALFIGDYDGIRRRQQTSE